MIQIILSVSFVLIVSCYIRFYLNPQNQIKLLKSQFEKHGYRVCLFPYVPYASSLFRKLKSDESIYGDCFWTFKEQLQSYDLIIANFLTRPHIITLNPDLIREVFNRQTQGCYNKQKLVIQSIERATGKGLLTSEGQSWKKKRKIVSKIFNYDLISNMFEQINQKCLEALNITQEQSKQINKFRNIKLNQGQYQYKIIDFARRAFSSVIISNFLGVQQEQQKINGLTPAEFYIDLIDNSALQRADFFAMIFGARFLDLGLRTFDRKVNQDLQLLNQWVNKKVLSKIQKQKLRIKQQKDRYTPKDILSAIIAQNIANAQKKEQNVYNLQAILDQFKTFFAAGSDTTTHLTQMMIYHIFSLPKVEQQLRKQIYQTVGDEKITFKNTKEMKYLQAVQKQTLRLSGPTSFIFCRQAIKDHYLGQSPIKKGTIVQNVMYTVHENQKYYKYPKQFRPQRWLNGQCDNLHPFAHVSFGGGSRSCIGKHLGLLQAKIGLIVFLQRYRKVQILCEKMKYYRQLVTQGQRYQAKMTRFLIK